MRRPVTVTVPPKAANLVLALIAVILGAALATFVLWQAHMHGRLLEGFYLVMGVVFALGLTAVFASTRIQTREIGCQSRLFHFLEEKELWQGIIQWAEDCLSLRVLRSLHQQQRAPASVDAKPFLRAMFTRLASGSNHAKVAGSACVALGLLGTMAGLSGMIANLQTVAAAGALVSGDGGDDLFAQLFGPEGPLRGLSAAFLTTLCGGALNLVLRNLANVVESSASHITDHLADAIARNFGPAIEGERSAA